MNFKTRRRIWNLILLSFFFVSFQQIGTTQCNQDCVWPGDLNANGIANNLDILAFGFALEEQGPARVDMSTDWQALETTDWPNNLPFLGTNYKHCDADGDGDITTNDQFPVSINYNKTNPDFAGLLGNELTGDDLFFIPQNTTASPSGSFFVDVHLGTADNIIENIYGIGFQVVFDTQYVQEVLFDYSDNWIGSGDEIFNYGKYSDEIEHAAATTVRLDGNAVTGWGKLLTMEIVITDVVLGLEIDSTACLPFLLGFENTLGINEFEEDLLITAKGDSLTLKDDSQITDVHTVPTKGSKIALYPNPAKDQFFIQNMPKETSSIVLYNAMGSIFYTKKITPEKINQHNFQIITPNIPRGLYLLEIRTPHASFTKKILLN